MNRPHVSDVQAMEESTLKASTTKPLPIATDNALAGAVIDEARRRGIEIGDDPELLAVLSRISGEEQIPRELYVAIAAVLGWVDGLK